MISASAESSTSGGSSLHMASESRPLLGAQPSTSSPLRTNETTPHNHKEKYPQSLQQTSYGSTNAAIPRTQRLLNDHAQNTPSADPCRIRLYFLFIFLLTLSCIAAILLLFLTPDFAQRTLANGMQLHFEQASILNVSDNGHNAETITMHVIGQLTLDDSVYGLSKKIMWLFGDIDTNESALEVFHLAAANKTNVSSDPMGTIRMPGLVIARDSQVTSFDFLTQFTVSDPEALKGFCQDAVVSETVAWRVAGPIDMNIGWLISHAKLSIDKQIALEGMNGLKQAQMQDISFPGAHPLGGIALYGRVGILNPSKTLSMYLGDVNFGIFLPNPQGDDVMIGVVRAHNASLLGQQENWFTVSGRTFPLGDGDKQALRLMNDFLTGYVHGNTTTVYVRGSAVGPDDPSDQIVPSETPEWLQKALESLTLQVPFPGTTQTELIESLELSGLKIDFSRWGDPLVSCNAVAMLRKPDEMQFSLSVTDIFPRVFLYLEKDAKEPFGRLSPKSACPADSIEIDSGKRVKVHSRMDKVPFTVLPGKEREFQRFLDKIFNEDSNKVYMRGTADASVVSAFGQLTIRDLAFQGELTTKGLQGMKNPPPKVTSITIVHGEPTVLHVLVTLLIVNPSDVDAHLGHVNVLLLYNNHVIGDAAIPALSLAAGQANNLTVQGRLMKGIEKASMSAMVQFIGEYISGEGDTSLTISGRHPNATQSKLLEPLIHQFHFVVQPPLFDEPPLLADMQMNLLSSTAILWLRNPFRDINIRLLRLNSSAYSQGQKIGTSCANFEDAGEGWQGPVVLPPVVCSGTHDPDLEPTDPPRTCTPIVVETPKVPVVTGKLGLDTIRKALGGELLLSVESSLAIMIDDLLLEDLVYQRDNITAKVRKTF